MFTPKDPSKYEWILFHRASSQIFSTVIILGVFGYHFTPYDPYPYHHFYPNDPQFFESASKERQKPSPDPILYKYDPSKLPPSDEFDSGERKSTYHEPGVIYYRKNSENSFDDITVGVENLVFFSEVSSGQHLKIVIRQGSDGMEPEYIDEDDLNIEDYFPPNMEVRIHSDHTPTEDELVEMKEAVRKFVKKHDLNPFAAFEWGVCVCV